MTTPESESVKLPPEFRDALSKQGATFELDPRGEDRPSHFGDFEKEIEAFRNSTVLFELCGRGKIQMTGEDRASFLHGFCTNDIKQLTPGEGCEAIATSIKSRILGHIFVSCHEDKILLDTAVGNDADLFMHLDKYLITDDVELTPQTSIRGQFLLAGPNAFETLKTLGWVSKDLEPNQHTTFSKDSEEIFIQCVEWFNGKSYLIIVPLMMTANSWNEIISQEVQPSGWQAFESIRIENKFPDYGRDMTQDHLAQELGRDDKAISFNKGCYLGQEPIARLDAMGHVNKILTKFTLDTNIEDLQSLVGQKLFHPTEDKELGRLTSVAKSTDGKWVIALGYSRTRETEPGMELSAKEAPNGPVAVTIS